MNVIEIAGLTHRYGRKKALDNLDLSIPDGALYALLGPNGSGKTTLLKILMGLMPVSSGRVQIFGKDIGDLTLSERAQIGYIAEGMRLPGWMTLRHLEGYLAPLYETWDYEFATELRTRFQLDEKQKISSMSRGEHMKAALLCALAPRPRVLLMDEPFTGMDVIAKDAIVKGMLEAAGRDGWTIVLCSHDIGELEALADWVGFLKGGRVTLSETADSLYAEFKHVDVITAPGASGMSGRMPAEWLSVQSAGPHLSFLSREDDQSIDDRIRSAIPETQRVDVRAASLREIFIALAGETSNHSSEVRL